MYFHSNPVPHRTHKKSRGGCLACKTRRVKCDEAKPVCKKCSIHFSNIKACDYGPAPESNKQIPSNKHVLKPRLPAGSNGRPVPAAAKEGRPSVPAGHLVSLKVGKNNQRPNSGCCGCPCHQQEFTSLLLDAIFGVCRICGNLPLVSSSPRKCTPIMPDAILMAGKIDPFSVLPVASSPRVHSLMHHWSNTLALVPTQIQSQYCTNPTWLSAAIANPSLFNITLFACSLHAAGLHGQKESPESVFYKVETVRLLNESLDDPALAVADETLAAVLLLTHIVSIIGEPIETKTHINGLQQMINLGGGIQKYAMGGVFLHMLCTTNHLTAVFYESTALHPATIPYTPLKSSTPQRPVPAHESPLLKPFAISAGFHGVMVDLLHDMGYLYAVLDVFTRRFLPEWRGGFEGVMASIEQIEFTEARKEECWM